MCGVQDWWRDHGATVATWLLVAAIASLVVPVWLGKASSDDAADTAHLVAAANHDQACRTEYAATVTGARAILDDASSAQDQLLNASWRAFIAEDAPALKALAPPLKEVSGRIDRANSEQLAANGLYQNLLRAQRTNRRLFAAMCETGPMP